MFGVVPFSAALLISIQSLNGGIDINADSGITEAQLMPNPFTQDAHQLQKGLGLVNAHAVQVAPECTRYRQFRKPEKSAQDGIKSNIGKMPDPVKAYKQQHQKPCHHRIMAQLGHSGRCTVGGVECLPKINQIKKFDHRQQPAKWAQLLAAGIIWRRSIDFPGLGGAFFDPFVLAVSTVF